MKTFCLLFLVSKFAFAGECAKAKVLSWKGCEEVKVEFNLTNCVEPEERKVVRTKCHDKIAEAVLKTKTTRYLVRFKEDNVWGDVRWDFLGLSSKKLK